MRVRTKKKVPKLNLIPILDAVFIFIFFLLMSAQFVEIYEIGSDAPTVKNVTKNNKEDPLNLTVDVFKNKLRILTGAERKVTKVIKKKNGEKDVDLYARLKNELKKIKQGHKNEKTIILRPARNIPYEKIVGVMDSARGYKKKNKKIKMFSEVVFEKL